MIRIAVIGDVHQQFTPFDVDYFNESDYDLLLFVGDLADFQVKEAHPVAEQMGRLSKPALYIPGNHDGVPLGQLVAEAKGMHTTARVLSAGQEGRIRKICRLMEPVPCVGYSQHPFNFLGHELTVIAARPFSAGGERLSFEAYLERVYGIGTLEASVARLQALVDATPTEDLIFLAHNGPAGLGDQAHDIWGRDFELEAGDYGDPDLTEAVAYARAQGKRVLAVVAGHMHRETKGGGERVWLVKAPGTCFVNAARVPRIFEDGQRLVHHHVRLLVEHGDETNVSVEDVLVPAPTATIEYS